MQSQITVTFKVAMDAEQAKLKNHYEITTAVLFPENCIEQVQKDALKTYVIGLQSQLRNNWDAFMEKGVPAEVTYGDTIFSKKRVVTRPPTEAEIAEHMGAKIARLSPEGINVLVTTKDFPADDAEGMWKTN